ncbi:unnamed protein product [Plutella xylostella]|uniref:RNA-directed DNA polymerase n=1 Tax=Plutella xylostella TaxID=51655 RepID=A0A8S4G6Q5_PLUXY|nr:unnamed protein product [Plutella xylostella]
MALSLEAAVRDSAAASSSGALGERPGQPGDHVYAVERRARGGRWGGGGDGGGRRRGEAAPRAPRTAASRESRGAWRRRAPTSSARRCYRCGQDHMADKCPFMSVECYVCGDRGHIAKMCKYRKDATVHHVIGDDVEVYEEASASASDSEREVYQLSDSEADDDHWNIKVNINGKDLLMEGDTGSALIQKFPNVFAPGIGAFNKGVIALELVEGAAPVWLRARSVPYALRPAVEAELARLQREGIISPVEWSEWGTPIVPVIKRSGEVRLCGDYKLTVNPVLVEDKYPIPRIEDVFMILQGGQCFSKIDLSRAYQQLLLNEKSKTYCTIVTHRGMFTYNRLPFGVKCAPSKFQRIMEKLFRIPYVAIYLDDVVITGDDDDDHLCRLMEVFRILSESGLRVEPKKCSFFNKSISYLGYVIDASGLRTEATKIDAINNTPAPGNIAELRAFLGLINYYGKFVVNLSDVLNPLYELLNKKQRYEWSKECETAFKEIKKRLLNAPVLAHFDPELETVVTCDASPYGVSAVLAQRTREGAERPVLHASRTLSAAEKNYAQICREGLAVIFAVTKFHDYLYGRHFTLVTDCKPLASIFSENKGIPSMAASRLQSIKQYLSIEGGCLLYGHRVVVPRALRAAVLQRLHATHQGMVQMKALARGFVYWPGVDADIERECRACAACQSLRPAPRAAPLHPWAWPQEPWFRLHLDFFSLSGNTIYYLVLVDAHSKWLEAYRVKSTSAQSTIENLRNVFARLGFPREAVTDNGPPFGSTEFGNFMSSCGIKHILVSPYKPSSNGAAESAVKIIKTCLKKAIFERENLDLALDRYLLMYRSTPHSATGRSPAELLLGRELRTPLHLLRPSLADAVRERQRKQVELRGGHLRSFEIGDNVMFKAFQNNKSFWMNGGILIDGEGRENNEFIEVCDVPSLAGPNMTSQSARVTPPPPERAAPATPEPIANNRPTRTRRPVNRYGYE